MSSNRQQQQQQQQQQAPPAAVQHIHPSMPAADNISGSTGNPSSQSLRLPPPFPPQAIPPASLPLLHRQQYPNAQRQSISTPNCLPQHLSSASASSSSSSSASALALVPAPALASAVAVAPAPAPAPAVAVAPAVAPPPPIALTGRPLQNGYTTYYAVTPAAVPVFPMPPVPAYHFPQDMQQENGPKRTHTNTNPHQGSGYYYPPQLQGYSPPVYHLTPALPLQHAYSQRSPLTQPPIPPLVPPPFQPGMPPTQIQLQRRPHSDPFLQSSPPQMFQEQLPRGNSFASSIAGPGPQQMPMQPPLTNRGGSRGEMMMQTSNMASWGREGSRENMSSTAGKMDDIRWVTKKTSKSWSKREDKLLLSLKQIDRLNWCQIASYFPDRTTNGCQFRWRRLVNKGKAGDQGKGLEHEENEEHGIDENVKE